MKESQPSHRRPTLFLVQWNNFLKHCCNVCCCILFPDDVCVCHHPSSFYKSVVVYKVVEKKTSMWKITPCSVIASVFAEHDQYHESIGVLSYHAYACFSHYKLMSVVSDNARWFLRRKMHSYEWRLFRMRVPCGITRAIGLGFWKQSDGYVQKMSYFYVTSSQPIRPKEASDSEFTSRMLCFGRVCASCALNVSAALQGAYITGMRPRLTKFNTQRKSAFSDFTLSFSKWHSANAGTLCKWEWAGAAKLYITDSDRECKQRSSQRHCKKQEHTEAQGCSISALQPFCHRGTGLPNLLFAKGPKKGQPFPNLSAVIKSYEPILSNLCNGNVPQSQL